MTIKNLIIIECGTTMSTDVNTGIQRVVRNIVKEVKEVTTELGIDYCLVKFEKGDFIEYENEQLPRKNISKTRRLLHFCDVAARQIIPEKIYHSVRERLKGVYNKFIKSKVKTNGLSLIRPRNRKLNSNYNDTIIYRRTLLLLDSTWNTSMLASVDKFREQGGHVCAVLYDLIPFTHPETVAEKTRIAHTLWWTQSLMHIDSILCISKSVREEFLVWQKHNQFSTPLPSERVGYFYLGAELNHTDPFVQVLSLRTPVYLVVGSLEPRKNHHFILDAFEKLWVQGCEVNLVIVGAFGWKSENLLTRIMDHSEFENRLFLIRDATDRDLTSLYDKCDALIIASMAEGFGLPIVEAFQRGTKVICSDIPVFREVAADQAAYFDLSSSSSLALKVFQHVEFLRNKSDQQSRIKIQQTSWKTSTQHLLMSLIECVESSPLSDIEDDKLQNRKVN
jgi:alpha-1,2-rhamnosyltransferase